MLLVGLFGMYTYKQDGFDFRLQNMNELKALDWDENKSKDPICSEKYPFKGYCLETNHEKEIDSILIGDSHANSLFWGLSKIFEKHNLNLLLLAHGGVVPFYDVENNFIGVNDPSRALQMNNILDFVIKNSNIKTVFLLSRGPLYLTGQGYHESELIRGGFLKSLKNPKKDNFIEIYSTAMKETLYKLSSADKQIYFIEDWAELGFNPKQCIDSRPFRLFGERIKNPCAIEKKEFLARNKSYIDIVKKVLDDFPKVILLKASNYFCDDEYCYAKKNGSLMYRDNNHLSLEGSFYLGKRLEKEIFY